MKEYKHPEPKDKRLSPPELSGELAEYILQFIPDATDELINMIEADSHNFVLRCLFNFRQR